MPPPGYSPPVRPRTSPVDYRDEPPVLAPDDGHPDPSPAEPHSDEPYSAEQPAARTQTATSAARGRRPRRIEGSTPAGRRSRKGLWAGLGAAVIVIAALVALSAFVWPGWVTKTLSQSGVEQGVERVLTDPVDQDGRGLDDVSEVSCPSGMKAQAGVTFTCAVKIGGENKRVTVTVLNDDGDYSVSEPGN